MAGARGWGKGENARAACAGARDRPGVDHDSALEEELGGELELSWSIQQAVGAGGLAEGG